MRSLRGKSLMSMRRIAGAAVLGAMLLGSGLFAPSAQAGYVVTLHQTGGNVVATGTGPIDLTGLFSVGSLSSSSFLTPSAGTIITGPASPATPSGTLYFGFAFTGPSNFGSGGATFANSGSGSIVGILADTFVVVPTGYVSGSILSDSATYSGKTFATLGVTPGTYEWTWGAGANQNFTLKIPTPAAIPEPASALLLGTAFAGLLLAGAVRRIRPEA